MKPRYSVIIPTYNHREDLLQPCLESIVKYSNMDDIEVIVVANGCTDDTKEYCESLDYVQLVWRDEAIGYTAATNLGIKASSGEFVLLLNNDTELLDQPLNKWLDMIVAPFADPEVGLSGPLMLHDDYADFDVIIFFCAMIRREVFDKVGILDEIFSPGGGEDIDFAVRTAQAGYKIVATTPTTFSETNVGGVPIWHKDNQTYKAIPEYTNHIVKRNGLINCKRYNKNIKLNLGSGGVPYKGYLSVDMYDRRAHVQMDITKLDFDDNSVTEILASHVFEHLNPYHSIAILEDWLRVLKPGGKLIMEMPDIEGLCKRFVTASTGERYGILNAIYGSVNTTDVGGPDNITSPHLFGWWRQSLWDHMTNAGFTNIQFMEEQIPHPETNLRVEANKPGGTPVPPTPKGRVDRESLKAQEPATYIEIFETDSYRLVDSEVRGKIVVDVGANLGMFSLRCIELGAKRIFSIEAQPTVYKLGLLNNVKGFSEIIPLNAAVWDKDGEQMTILNEHVGSKVTAGGEGDKVSTITLKTLVDGTPEDDIVLKLDCEGSEFNILLNTDLETIRKFAFIHIELHANTNENPDYQDVEVVRNKLTEFGFERVSMMPVLWFGNNGETREIGVYVEKWVRV
jgi:FkbM family methyltransferase